MPADTTYLDSLFSKRDSLIGEIAVREKSVKEYRARYEDWAAKAAKTQSQNDIDTRDSAYQEWYTRNAELEAAKKKLIDIEALIKAEITKQEGEALTADQRADIETKKLALQKEQTEAEAADAQRQADRGRKMLIYGIVLIVVIVVSLIFLKKFRVF